MIKYTEVTCEELFTKYDLSHVLEAYKNCGNGTPEEHTQTCKVLSQADYWKLYQPYADNFACMIVTKDDEVIGGVILELSQQMHFGYKIAYLNSLYMLPEHRNDTLFFRKVFKLAKKHGCKGIYLLAPAGSELEQELNKYYIKTNSMFYKEL